MHTFRLVYTYIWLSTEGVLDLRNGVVSEKTPQIFWPPLPTEYTTVFSGRTDLRHSRGEMWLTKILGNRENLKSRACPHPRPSKEDCMAERGVGHGISVHVQAIVNNLGIDPSTVSSTSIQMQCSGYTDRDNYSNPPAHARPELRPLTDKQTLITFNILVCVNVY